MNDAMLNKTDEVVMRLLHYFITKKNYNPIVLHGAKNEIWLENLDSKYKIIRIVSNYIHNDEQLNYDILKTNQIVKQIRKKTFSFKLKTLSLFVNMGENVTNTSDYENLAHLDEFTDINKYEFIINEFPDINLELEIKEEGINLFTKIMDEINAKNQVDATRAEELFKPKKPVMTYVLILLNIIFFAYTFIISPEIDPNVLFDLGAITNETLKTYEFNRLILAMFLHANIIHLGVNMYALYILGPQIENFFGKYKFLFIYIVSGIVGSLFSILFLPDYIVGVGASGAIFGLLSALIYFGNYYRVYFGTVIKTQLLPLIVFNLAISLIVSGIDLAAHIGGLVGGLFATMCVGVAYKTTKTDQINGVILTLILISFLLYLGIYG